MEKLELKLYLKRICEELSEDYISELLLSDDLSLISNFIEEYKLTFNNISRIKDEKDKDLINLIREFSYKYKQVLSFYKKKLDKELFNYEMDEIVKEYVDASDILCDLYTSDIKLSQLIKKYRSEEVNDVLSKLCTSIALVSHYEEDPTYELTKNAKRYISDKYFYEEKNAKKYKFIKNKEERK